MRIRYDQPYYDENNELCNETVFLDASEAIKRQRQAAYDSHGFIYKSDKEALEDFMTIHYAEIVHVHPHYG